MKRKLMEYIVCANCRGNLTLRQFETSGFDIEEGLLCCEKCEARFPVIEGIPRILSSDLLPKLVSNYESFMRKHGLKYSDAVNLAVYDSDAGIAEGFEFEWQKHSEVLREHEKEFLHVLGDVLPPNKIKEKIVLDAGCGQGRFSYFSHKYGAATVIAFDLGEQTLLAQKNLRGKEDVHVVQASIYDAPFKSVFDLIFCIGVIHHLPEPEKGFRNLYELLKKDGKVFIWVYGYSSIIPVIKVLRKFTLGKSLKFNRILGFLVAIPLYAMNQFYNFLKIVPLCEKFAELIPFHMYHDRGFSNIWTISFDKINSGIAHYYKREDLQGWLDRLSDNKSSVLRERYPGKSGSSWRLLAEK